MNLTEVYEKETGQAALYRMKSSDYHTLRYVRWLEAKLRELAEAAEWRDEVLYDYEHEKSFFVFKTSQPTKEDWIRAENADKSFFSIKEAAEAAYQDALKAAEAPCSTTASSSPGC